ncbi:Serine aminopeptidase, S33 [Reichenbachiella agariperforans]|uniref:Serine aminopeptidase, S33 n=2 Tax=Reichenbachiella TaxID=156993 RepID=A0A1M6J5J6_REIAG|nr:alpha/beta hydrolase [Reichenbachiella agariperforans]SHJ41994.1 Serine aminopeptidase, S33 [Reichenbachiella agariperforans]
MPITRLILLFVFLLFGKACLALSPSRTYKTLPQDHRMKYESIKIPTPDGAILQAWYFPSSRGNQLMVISHDGVENMAAYLERVRIFVNYGFNVVTYDYRGFGGSSDFQIDPLNYIYKEFFTDFDAVIAYVSERFDHEIIVYGWGIGAGIGLNHGYNRHQITGIIADNPYVDFAALGSRFKAIHSPMKIPSSVMIPEFNTITVVSQPAGKDLRGILYFHGNENYVFKEEDMQRLYDQTDFEFKQLHVFEKSGHMDNFTVNESTYARIIYGFVMNF